MKNIFRIYSILFLFSSRLFGTDETALWMEKLPEHIKTKSITEIAIPGSHDAATHLISTSSNIGDDQKDARELLNLPLIKTIHVKWSKAQQKSIYEQLKAGSRYLDFRVCFNAKNEAVSCHGLESQNYSEIFSDIKQFLKESSKEVIIIDFQKFHFSHQLILNHKQVLKNFFQTIEKEFKDELYDQNTYNKTNNLYVSLKELDQQKKRLILLSSMPNSHTIRRPWIYNRDNNIQSIWHNKDDPTALKQDIEQTLFNPPPKDDLFVLQAQLTPNHLTVAKSAAGLFLLKPRSLKELADISNEHYMSWFTEWKEKKAFFNIFMVDFINESLAKKIIDFNLL